MTAEHGWLAAAAAVFILLHTAISSTGLRGGLVGVLGEGPYMGLFALASAASLVWMSTAYTGAPYVALWEVSRPVRLGGLVLMAPVFVLLAAGLTTRSPTGIGGATGPGTPKVRGILRITRHPIQWAILIWSLLHVLVNGHLAALLFFGALALLSVMGPFLIDRKRRVSMGERWEAFAASTSNVPFAAILSGRNRLNAGEIGWKATGLGLGLYILIVSAHPYVIGMNAY